MRWFSDSNNIGWGVGRGGGFYCFDDMVASRAVTTLYRTVSTVLSEVVASYPGRGGGGVEILLVASCRPL